VTAARRATVIGITGPIGCGKSTVARWLGEQPGVEVIDADQAAREVVEPGSPGAAAVLARFGDAVRAADGAIDRAALGRIVFSDPAALRDLEAIVHPLVRPRMLAAIDAASSRGARAVIVEAIKLVEGGLADHCDEVWLVECRPDVQLERLVGRGTATADAEQRIAGQGGLVGRVRPRATRLIDTSGDEAATRRAAEAALAAAIAVAGGVSPTA
jgi:dephospho-CoA kinase